LSTLITLTALPNVLTTYTFRNGSAFAIPFGFDSVARHVLTMLATTKQEQGSRVAKIHRHQLFVKGHR
jgi:hypothetical protein